MSMGEINQFELSIYLDIYDGDSTRSKYNVTVLQPQVYNPR